MTDPAAAPRKESRYFSGRTPADTSRREAIQALIDRGATEGEREAARAALGRLDSVDAAKIAELEHAVGFGWRKPSQTAHDLTEQGSYYARDNLAGSSDE